MRFRLEPTGGEETGEHRISQEGGDREDCRPQSLSLPHGIGAPYLLKNQFKLFFVVRSMAGITVQDLQILVETSVKVALAARPEGGQKEPYDRDRGRLGERHFRRVERRQRRSGLEGVLAPDPHGGRSRQRKGA